MVAGILNGLKTVWWMIPIILLLAFLKRPTVKGWMGEQAVKNGLDNMLDEAIYQPFHDLIIPYRHQTTQIDHLYLSPYGIFVVETKNYTGWIYGSEKQARWTQVVYHKKSSFQNPLRQNYAHIKALALLLGVSESCFHSVVVFVGDCEFKTDMPPQVGRLKQAGRYIGSFQEKILNPNEIQRMTNILSQAQYQADRGKRQAHKQMLQQRR
ncbi:nuclease-related domain-containing protein [Neisseria perflava]|uniref:nuclease-related domain-containing protein n=1 Tax=Neisseria perflava TaxID=33053 RepID=UPI003F593181